MHGAPLMLVEESLLDRRKLAEAKRAFLESADPFDGTGYLTEPDKVYTIAMPEGPANG